ncbi:venom allergen 5-like [Pieris brassicae]|uniref:venom allergen 5-like n=1 Tax=Pieris brassicae TaxID=7116 RepID=UPI001E65E588|nr:venom allergen 5-like [Pieris brassicae]XP_045514075.1 venom allergen 5-like [Pieris brassicae]
MYRFVLFLTLFSYAASKSELSCRHIREFVDRHNYWRLKLAKGEIPNQPAASEMKYIIWDEELAAKAAQWASNNEYKHNPDKSVGSNRFFTGENIFSTASTDLSYKFEPRSVVDSWFSEHKYFKYGALEDSGKKISDYPQVAWSDSIYLGCGVSKEYKNGWLNYYVVCNYGPTGNLGRAPYPAGQPSGQLVCANDCSRFYGDKCSVFNIQKQSQRKALI